MARTDVERARPVANREFGLGDVDVARFIRPGADSFELDPRLSKPGSEVSDQIGNRPIRSR